MAKFRKKPIVIDAILWDGNNLENVIEFTNGRRPGSGDPHVFDRWQDYENLVARDGLKIFTLEGPLLASVGDWIIRGVRGELYPVKPDIFEATYEKV